MSYTSVGFAGTIFVTRDQFVSHTLWDVLGHSLPDFDLRPACNVDEIRFLLLVLTHGCLADVVAEPFSNEFVFLLGKPFRVEEHAFSAG